MRIFKEKTKENFNIKFYTPAESLNTGTYIMTKMIVNKVNATMVEKLVNFENYKNNALQEMEEFVNVHSRSFTNDDKERILENFEHLLRQEEEIKRIELGDFLFVLKYDEFNNSIIFEDKKAGFSFTVGTEHIDDDYYNFLDVACCINDKIKDYFGDKIVEDCGEYWGIKE